MKIITQTVRKLLRIVRNEPALFLLIGMVTLLVLTNYEPGTILSGWDTLHPEFNRLEYLKRIFFGVWQPHQGLGALATQAHASELTRMIVYLPLSLLLPTFFVRYAYMFLMMYAGTIGVYMFLRHIVFAHTEAKIKDVGALAGGLFYLLNLGTLQHFYVPLEMFTTHFATMPWLFFFSVLYLQKGRKRDLWWFVGITLAATSIAHTATLWYAYAVAFLFFLFVYTLINFKRITLKRAGILVLLTVLLNLFWLIPNVYFVLTQGHIVENAKIHKLFTEEAFLQNASFGTLPSLMLFKNFLFNWGQFIGNNRFGPILQQWIDHLAILPITLIGYIFFGLIMLGIGVSIKQKNRILLPFLTLFALGVFFWININPPFTAIYQYMRDNLPLFREAVRFPFTKFSLVLLFACSLYLGVAIQFLLSQLEKLKYLKRIYLPSALVIMTLFFIYMFPAFRGNFINPAMRVTIPKEYFSMFQWFQKEDYGRVAELPIHSFWGWVYYKWGYQGAGYLWFGIKQPLLDREFDRWDPANEQYYREMSYAVYTQDVTLLKNVLHKYDIKYLLLDENVIAPGADPKVLFYKETEALLARDTEIKKVKQFGKDIRVYQVLTAPKEAYLIHDPVLQNTSAPVYPLDTTYSVYGNYINNPAAKDLGTVFPFKNIADNEGKVNPNIISLDQNGAELYLKTPKAVSIPTYTTASDILPTTVFAQVSKNQLALFFYPLYPFQDGTTANPIVATIPLPAKSLDTIAVSVNHTDIILLSHMPQDVPFALGKVFLQTKSDNVITLFNANEKTQTPIDFSELPPSLYPCNDRRSNEVYGIDISPLSDGFSLFGKNTAVCGIIPLERLLPALSEDNSQSLLQADFTYTGGFLANLCLARLKDGACLNYSIKSFDPTRQINLDNSLFADLSGESIHDLGVKVFYDTTHTIQKKTTLRLDQASYTNFSVGTSKILSETTITPSDIQTLLPNIKTQTFQKLTIPYSGSNQDTTNVTTLPKTDGYCEGDFFNDVKNSKEIRSDKDGNYIRYTSHVGSLCDHFSYQTLPQNQGYLIAVTSRNVSGLPIRFCVTNYFSKRCDIYAQLSTSKDFTTDVFLLPPMVTAQTPGTTIPQGFDININNFGINRESSVNDLTSIRVLPFPYTWFSELSYGAKPTPAKDETKDALPSEKRYNPSLYALDLPQTLKHNAIVAISQAYNTGWRAYGVSSINPFSLLLPFVFGHKIQSHVVVNDWENGWMVDPQTAKHIIVAYLPQYMEYGGLIILVGTIATLWYLSKGGRHA